MKENKKQNWYFTFGFGQPHEGRYHKIYGTYGEARNKMFKRFGKKWAFQYSEEQWLKDNGVSQAEEFGYTEIKKPSLNQ